MDIKHEKLLKGSLNADKFRKYAAILPAGIDEAIIGKSLKDWSFAEIQANPKHQQLFGELIFSLHHGRAGYHEELVEASFKGNLDAPGHTYRKDFNDALDNFSVRMAMLQEIETRLTDSVVGYLVNSSPDLASIAGSVSHAELAKFIKDKAGSQIMDVSSSWPQAFLAGLESARKISEDPTVEHMERKAAKLCKKYGIELDQFQEIYNTHDRLGAEKKLKTLVRKNLKTWQLAANTLIAYTDGAASALMGAGDGAYGTIQKAYQATFLDVGNLLKMSIDGNPDMKAALAQVAASGTYEAPKDDSPTSHDEVKSDERIATQDHDAEVAGFAAFNARDAQVGGRKFKDMLTTPEKHAFIRDYCREQFDDRLTNNSGHGKGLFTMLYRSLLRGTWKKVENDLLALHP